MSAASTLTSAANGPPTAFWHMRQWQKVDLGLAYSAYRTAPHWQPHGHHGWPQTCASARWKFGSRSASPAHIELGRYFPYFPPCRLALTMIIDRLGGEEAAARLTGVGTEAVRKWRQARAIPSRHWPAVIAAAGAGVRRSASGCDGEAERGAGPPEGATAALVLADGSGVLGPRVRRPHRRSPAPVGEVCFNTGMTGYQETLTDPSYAGQIITFTFPHIGNVGTNAEDIEAATIAARGLVVKQDVTEPSNWRAPADAAGVAARAGHRRDRRRGHARADRRGCATAARRTACWRFPPTGGSTSPRCVAQAQAWPGLEGMDLAKDVSCTQTYAWDETRWAWPDGDGPADGAAAPRRRRRLRRQAQHPALPGVGRLPGDGGAGDGDGRGHPAPRAGRRVPVQRPGRSGGDRRVCGAGDPRRAGGGRAAVRHLPRPSVAGAGAGRRGPTSWNAAIAAPTSRSRSWRPGAWRSPARTTASRWTRRRCRRACEGDACVAVRRQQRRHRRSTGRPVFSVQYHPEASPGPSDSHHLFGRFVAMMEGA